MLEGKDKKGRKYKMVKYDWGKSTEMLACEQDPRIPQIISYPMNIGSLTMGLGLNLNPIKDWGEKP